MSLGTRFSTNEKRGANFLNQRKFRWDPKYELEISITHVFSLKETKRGSSSTERTNLSEHPRPSLWTSNVHFKKFSLEWVSDPWRSVWFQVRGRGWTEWAGAPCHPRSKSPKTKEVLPTGRQSHTEGALTAVRAGPLVTTAVGERTLNVLKPFVQSNTEGKIFLVIFGRC